ncbi:unnamed protein product, partial [Laminaria digitata]
MVGGGDLARVAKGAAKVARALLDNEGPAAGRQVLRLKEHGVGLTSSLRNAVSLAVASAPHQDHQNHQEQPPMNTTPPTAGSEDRTGYMASTNGASPAIVSHSWQPDSVEGGQHTQNHTPPPLYDTRIVGSTTPVTATAVPASAVAQTSVRSAVAAQIGSLQEQASALPLSGDVLQPSSVGGDAGAATQESKVSRAAGSSPKSWSGATALSDASAESFGDGASPLTSAANGTRDDLGPWKFGQSAGVTSSTGEAGGSKVDGATGTPRAPRQNGMTNSRTRTVPSSPLARVFGFGQLAAGLAMGTVAEAIRQSVRGGEVDGGDAHNGGRKHSGTVKQYVVSDANAERLAESLCRMRGAALKLGQMLSIQDESVIPPSLAKALDRVRQGADVMPAKQLHRQLEKSLGVDWRSRLASFDETPIAAASIGQVHRARLLDGTEVAMKIQYPGVADSVESDLKNLQRLVQLTNILPPGLYIDEIIEVAREELGEECDYEKEAANQERFRALVESDDKLNRWASVPKVVPDLLSKEVLTTHLAPGVPVDQVLPMPQQEVRNHVARLMLRCTMNELFDWRFMQTDPNWGNFLFDTETGKMSLIDFGACREYRKDFVDDYLRLVWAAANRDDPEIMRV